MTDAATGPLLSLILAHRASMTPRHRRIADYVAAHPLQAATMGIEDLAGAAGVSVATVNRFVRALGLDGYAEFRARSLARFRLAAAPVEKLREREGRAEDPASIIAGSFRAVADNLRHSEFLLDDAACRRAVELIEAADRVVLLGFGISASLVQFAADLIAPFCKAVVVLDGFGGTERMVRSAMSVGRGDLVIAVTLPRYSQATRDLMRSMRDQGAATLGLTDAPTAPIMPFCDIALFAAAQHPLLHASSAALIALVEGLVAILTQRRQTVAAAAELTCRILPYLLTDDACGGPDTPTAGSTE